MSVLAGPADVLAALHTAGVRTVADVLARAECVRDLPDRSNHVLRLDSFTCHVKRTKKGRMAREARGIERAAAAGVPTATLAFRGADPVLGALTGTLDLAPAAPLDDLLRAEQLTLAQRRAALKRLAIAVAALHDAGLHHRDLYCNHVFARASGTDCRIALIDLERLGAHRRPLGRRPLKDLAAIAVSLPEGTTTVRERARFLLRYLRRRGLDRRKVYVPLVRRIRRKADRIRAHVPRTPVGAAARPGSERT